VAVPARWQPRNTGKGRPLLPVDLRFGMAVALILAAAVQAAVEPHLGIALIRQQMLSRIRRQVIYEKPGRSYPRHQRNKHRGSERGKGNTKAQYQRRKLRRKLAKQRKPGG